MTRNGKIAHLPLNIRNELNLRMENGEEGATLLPWLNALPEVLQTLKENFDGLPITKQNLSEWRQGGFREWQIRDELIAQARQLSDSANEMEEVLDIPLLAGALAGLLAARYAALLNSWDGEPDPKFEEKLRLLRGLNRDIALLQKTMQQASRQNREFDQALEDREKRQREEAKQEALAPILAKVESDGLEALFSRSAAGRKLAQFMAAVKYDLPLPTPKPKEKGKRQKEESRGHPAKSPPRRQTRSKPVKPSPTESNQVSPGQTGQDPVQPSPTQSNPVTPDLAAEKTPDAAPETSNEGE
jgi:hypothetical protein